MKVKNREMKAKCDRKEVLYVTERKDWQHCTEKHGRWVGENVEHHQKQLNKMHGWKTI
jgi:hypothetical protein